MYDRPKNLKSLRVVKTARTLTTINSAVDSGFRCLDASPQLPKALEEQIEKYPHLEGYFIWGESAYHLEIDTMLAGLLKWCTESTTKQLMIFSERDKSLLMVVTAANHS